MAGMTISLWAGVVSVILFMGSLFPSPFSGDFAIISSVLGIVAAIRGSKWWLAVPVAIIGMTVIMMHVMRHAD